MSGTSLLNPGCSGLIAVPGSPIVEANTCQSTSQILPWEALSGAPTSLPAPSLTQVASKGLWSWGPES